MYNPPFLDLDKINEVMIYEKMPSYDKLKFIYKNMEGRFHDDEERLIIGW